MNNTWYDPTASDPTLVGPLIAKPGQPLLEADILRVLSDGTTRSTGEIALAIGYESPDQVAVRRCLHALADDGSVRRHEQHQYPAGDQRWSAHRLPFPDGVHPPDLDVLRAVSS